MMAVPPARVVRGVGGRYAHLRVAAVDGARTAGRYLALALRVSAVVACLGVVLALVAVGASPGSHRMSDPYRANQKLLDDLRRWSDAQAAQRAQLEAQRAQLELQQIQIQIEIDREIMLATHPR